jgi:diacylglycerol kinase (ATP)
MDKKLFIFANEKCADRETINRLTAYLPKKAHLLITKDFDEVRRSINPSYDALIAAGGDGTLNGLINIAVNEGLQNKDFGVIPIGTGNDFAYHALRFTDINGSIDNILLYSSGVYDNTREYDIGYITLREKMFFHNVAGLGFDAKTVEQAKHYKKLSPNNCYRIAAGMAMIPYWINSTGRMNIKYNDKNININALMATLMNSTHAGSGIPLNPYGSARDGLLDLLVLEKGSITNFAKLFLGISAGNIKVLEDKHVHKFRELTYEVSADRKLPLQYDGELHTEYVDGFTAGFAFKMKFIC